MKRLLGYVVRLPDGQWLARDVAGQDYGTDDKAGRAIYPDARRAAIAQRATDDRAVVLPLFATRKPKPAPATGRSVPQWFGIKPKPAPAEGAAEGEYALRDPAGHFVKLASEREIGNRATVEKLKLSKDNIVRILPDGAHEAACEAARREGAEAARIDALLGLRDACEFKADTVSDEAAIGLRMAMLFVDKALTKTAEEAAKGQAQ